MPPDQAQPNHIKFCVAGPMSSDNWRLMSQVAESLKALAPVACRLLLTTGADARVRELLGETFASIQLCSPGNMAAELQAMPSGPLIVDAAAIPFVQTDTNPLCLFLPELSADRTSDLRLPAGRIWNAVVVHSAEPRSTLPPGSISTADLHYVTASGANQAAEIAQVVLRMPGNEMRGLMPWRSLSQAQAVAAVAGMLAQENIVPAVRVDINRGVFEAAVVDGQTACELLQRENLLPSKAFEQSGALAMLKACVRQLGRFHSIAAHCDGGSLPLHDPTRLLLSQARACRDQIMRQRAIACAGALSLAFIDIELRIPRRETIVHGDLGSGRFVFPNGDGLPLMTGVATYSWGRPESDFANFIVDVVAPAAVSEQGVLPALRHLSSELRPAYDAAHTSEPLDTPMIGLFAAGSLLTRALELSEGGETGGHVQGLMRAAELLAGTAVASEGDPGPSGGTKSKVRELRPKPGRLPPGRSSLPAALQKLMVRDFSLPFHRLSSRPRDTF